MSRLTSRREGLNPIYSQLAILAKSLDDIVQQVRTDTGLAQQPARAQNGAPDLLLSTPSQSDYETRFEPGLTEVEDTSGPPEPHFSAIGLALTSLTWRWADRTFSAVEVRGGRIVLNSNGEALHEASLKNVSRIHKKFVNIWVEAYRVDTGALVFTFGYFGGRFGRSYQETKTANRFEQDVKTHWHDIVTGNISFVSRMIVRNL